MPDIVDTTYTNLGPILQGIIISQQFKAEADNLSGISLYIATYCKRIKSVVTLKIWDATRHTILRTTSYETASMADNYWQHLDFDTIPDSRGKLYWFSLETDGIEEAITLWTNNHITGNAYKNDLPLAESVCFRALYGKRPEEEVNFNLATIYEGHFKTTYRGVKAVRCPFDYVIYQMILFETQPDLVIELGTHTGGGALYLADLMNNLGHGQIHTIDIEPIADPLVAAHPRIKLFTEGWENYDLANAQNFEKILVIDDASHMYEATLEALYKFSSLVTPGSYYIVEDGIVNEIGRDLRFNGGPLRAIREFLSKNTNFQVDRHWCNLYGQNATFNVNGYLKRIS